MNSSEMLSVPQTEPTQLRRRVESQRGREAFDRASIRYSRLNRLKQAKATLFRSQMRRTVRSSGIEANPCRTGCGVVHHGRITARGGADVVHLRPEGAVPDLGVAGQTFGLRVVAEQHGAVTVGIVRHGARGSGRGAEVGSLRPREFGHGAPPRDAV